MSNLAAEVRESMSLPRPDVARTIRRDAGVSRERLGIELGVTDMTVWRWETGRRTPRGNTRLAYIRLLRDLGEAARDPEDGGT